MHELRTLALCLMLLGGLSAICPLGYAQAALLMEEPYGFFGFLNPTGHDAMFFARICAETPIKVRRCTPGEPGAAITRYQGIAGYDWVAMPLIPYLYSVENPSEAPVRVDRQTVISLRERYHEAHLLTLGEKVPEGGTFQRGWNQLVGVAYERRIYAFRFATTEAQDDALIASLNAGTNHSHYSLVFWNCADFSSALLNRYFPHTFRRSLFPDAGITTPMQVTYELVRYAGKHPETELAVFAIPQIPGYRGPSRTNKSIARSLLTSGYVVPLAVLCPPAATALVADYFAWGRYPLRLKQAQVLAPVEVTRLAFPASPAIPEQLESRIAPQH
jgi:hypothetical protein